MGEKNEKDEIREEKSRTGRRRRRERRRLAMLMLRLYCHCILQLFILRWHLYYQGGGECVEGVQGMV